MFELLTSAIKPEGSITIDLISDLDLDKLIVKSGLVQGQSSNWILFMDADRSDQTRGVTSLTTAINNIANIEDLIHFETVGVKMKAVS